MPKRQVYAANQLPELLLADPQARFVAVLPRQENDDDVFHCIYVDGKNPIEDQPFRAIVSVSRWHNDSDSENYFLEAMTVEHLLVQLEQLDEVHLFAFFTPPEQISARSLNLATDDLLAQLFPEVFELPFQLSDEAIAQQRHKVVNLLTQLQQRL